MVVVPGSAIDAANRPTPARPRAGTPGWRGPAGLGPSAAASPAPAVPGLSLDGLLAVQGGPDDTERDQLARRDARALLDALAGLQRGLLTGGDLEATLAGLHDFVSTTAIAADPGLAAIVAAIRLRARLELARHLKQLR